MTPERVDEVAELLKQNYLKSGKYHLSNVSDGELTNLLKIGGKKCISLLHLVVDLDWRDGVKKFIDLGVDVNLDIKDFPLPIFFAISLTVIEMLMRAGANIHLKCQDYPSFFEFVCMQSSIQKLEFLVERDPNLLPFVKKYYHLECGDKKEYIMLGAFAIMNEHGLGTTILD